MHITCDMLKENLTNSIRLTLHTDQSTDIKETENDTNVECTVF